MEKFCNSLPGSLSKEQIIQQLIRVNQAGEYGAKRIYQGQMAVLKNDSCIGALKHMAEQEEEHLSYFNGQVRDRMVRPTALMPVWHVLGYALGAGTALLGKKAAMACTVAVEEVIDEHYQQQLVLLKTRYADEETILATQIEQFRQEELEHRDTGLEHHAKETPGYDLLTGAIKAGSRLAIWLSKRI
jgi:3-demethoxyubiquinol 3-hydroxylase